jgi:GNAT superfamily N-acetyltransferase
LRGRSSASDHARVDTLTERRYGGLRDLRLMQERLGRDIERTTWRSGDLAWASRMISQLDLSLHVRLLFDGDDLAGWTWVWGRGLIDVHLAPDHRRIDTYHDMLAAAEQTVRHMVEAGDEVSPCRVWADEDDAALADALTRRGFAAGGADLQVNRRSLENLPAPTALPPGWLAAAVDSDDRVAARVECHRAAFAPSSLTVEQYNRVRRIWPYRAELDRVILDGEGAAVAACTAWLDDAVGDGLLEPVSTRPADQRRGFGRAVCIDALHALRAAGARSAQVGCIADSPACATYLSIGFEPRGRLLGKVKDL